METLLSSSLVQVVGFFPFVLQPGLLLLAFFFLPLQVELLVLGFHVVPHLGLGVLEIILEHPPHTVELHSLLIVQPVLVLLLLLLHSLLLYLLVQPLLLLVLEELSPGVIF